MLIDNLFKNDIILIRKVDVIMKNKKILIFIIGAILIVAGILCFFLWPRKSKKEVYIEAVKKSLGIEYAESKKDSWGLSEGVIKHFTVSGGNDEFNIKSFDFYIAEDKAYMTGIIPVEGEEVTFEGLVKDDNFYFTLKDLLEKYYYFKTGSDEKTDTSAIDKLEEIVKDNLAEAIENKNVKKEDTTRTINKKEYKVTEYSYTFKGTDIYNILKNIVEDIKNDKNLANDLFGESTAKNIDKTVEELLKSMEPLKEVGDIISYSVYLKSDELISAELRIYIPSGSGSQQMSIPVAIGYNKLDGFFEAYVSTLGARLGELVVDKKAGTIALSVQGSKIIEGTITDSKIVVNTTGKGLPEIGAVIEKGNGKYTLTLNVMGEEIKINVTSEEVKTFPSIDVSGAVPYNEATGNDKDILDALGFGLNSNISYQDLLI